MALANMKITTENFTFDLIKYVGFYGNIILIFKLIYPRKMSQYHLT